MIQLHILSGRQAGAFWVARRFPVRVGRGARSDLRLEADGVWEEHFEIDLKPGVGFQIAAKPEAFLAVNGQAVQSSVLSNGDLLELGTVKLQFWLAAVGQGRLRSWEWMVWVLLAAVVLSEIALMLWLPR